MNKLLLGAAIAALCAAPAFAGTYNVNDLTLDFAYQGNHTTTYSAPGFSGPTTGDHVGADFDTQKLVATVGPNSLTLQYYTNFGGDDLGAHYADIFLAPASNPNQAPAWGYGLALGALLPPGGTRTDNFQDAVANGFYALTGGKSDYLDSQDVWGPLGDSFIYGGGYIAPDGTQNLSPVRVTGGDPMAGWTVHAEVDPSGDANYPFIVDVVLTAPDTGSFNSLFSQGDLDVFWGTGDCSNDALFAALGVPEPMTLSIFGAGVAGAVAYGRRKKKKS